VQSGPVPEHSSGPSPVFTQQTSLQTTPLAQVSQFPLTSQVPAPPLHVPITPVGLK
jgi:hypothetical protein